MIEHCIKLVLCSGLLILAYKFALENEKMHQFNRFILLLSIIFSVIFPLFVFPSSAPVSPVMEIYSSGEATPALTLANEPLPLQQKISAETIILWAYAIITIGMLLRFCIHLKVIFKKISQNPIIPYYESKLVLLENEFIPHSFMNYIFLNKEEFKNGLVEQEVLRHELTHVRQKHSLDILFIELVQVFLWFNPFWILYRKAVKLNHEFLADEVVVKQFNNPTSYQYLIIDKARKKSGLQLASQFNYSITKKRLIMITKKTSPVSIMCNQIAMICVIALSGFLFSTRMAAQDTVTVIVPSTKEAPSTKEGVSKELLDEYDSIVSRHKKIINNGIVIYSGFTIHERERMQTIFTSMSKEQQSRQIAVFVPAPRPFSRRVPTSAELSLWNNPNMYGVWIDGKRIDNKELQKYQNTDFDHVFVSKLTKNAINYGKHYYQVDLMTRAYYADYYEKASHDDRLYLWIRAPKKQ